MHRSHAQSAPVDGALPSTPAKVQGELASEVQFNQIFADNSAYVLGLVARLGVANADVEDVAQEVFLAVHRGLDRFEGRSQMRTWICGITLRCVRNHRRRKARRRDFASPLSEQAYAPAGQAAAVDTGRRLAVLGQALDAMVPERRDVFVLFEVEGLSMVEVARVTGSPKFTAYTRLYAARRDVQRAMRKAGLEAAP